MPTIIFAVFAPRVLTPLFIGTVIVLTSVQVGPVPPQAEDVIDDLETYAVYAAALKNVLGIRPPLALRCFGRHAPV
ncbi:MAG: hypothetical protein LC753_05810 [Acidobacteria bacterium]|nr:hypothetical protein [Acidobacteriota bacterium]MCA1649806.1 hypothetical protein [Acidobacteriota bacterium]